MQILDVNIGGIRLDRYRQGLCTIRLSDTRNPSHVKTMLGVHVDGIIVTSSSCDFEAFVRFLSKSLPTINLRELTCYASCVFEWDWEGRTLKISQVACLDQLADRFNIALTSPVTACSSVKLRVRH